MTYSLLTRINAKFFTESHMAYKVVLNFDVITNGNANQCLMRWQLI